MPMQQKSESVGRGAEEYRDPLDTNAQSIFIRVVESHVQPPQPHAGSNNSVSDQVQESVILSRKSSLSFVREDQQQQSSFPEENIDELLATTKVKTLSPPKNLKQQKSLNNHELDTLFIPKTQSQGEESEEEINKSKVNTQKRKFASQSQEENHRNKKKIEKKQYILSQQVAELKEEIQQIKPYLNKFAKMVNSQLTPLKTKKNLRRSKFVNEELVLPNNFASIRKISNQLRAENEPLSERKNEEASEILKFQKDQLNMLEESGMHSFYRDLQLKKNENRESIIEESSELEIPELLIDEFPMSTTEKELSKTVRSLYQKFYKCQTKKLKIKSYKNGYQVHFEENRAILWFKNGTFYIGGFEEGKGKEGKGYEYKPQHYHYIGYFSHGKKNGNGLIKTIQGIEYNGEWLNNVRHGKGKQIDEHGNQYSGSWQNNLYHGRGKLIKCNGQTFEGQFAYGMKNGYGVWTDDSGDKYKGTFVKNKKDGYGEYYWAHGKVFKGEFKNGFKVREKKNVSLEKPMKSSFVLESNIDKRTQRKKISLSVMKPMSKSVLGHTQESTIGYNVETINVENFSHRKSILRKKI